MDLTFLQSINIEEAKNFLKQRGLKDNENATRAKILSCWESIDIPSCPGSGKTTILVTKLAWAIERWKLDGAGICVLSHTNVAKDEIRKRLTSNQANRLLRYPHFVGTIHEFVNRFIALPYMRSVDKKVKLIDDEFHDEKARTLLNTGRGKELATARIWQSKHIHSDVIGGLRLVEDDLKFKDTNSGQYKNLPVSSTTSSYCGFKKIKESLHKNGFYCHDELLFLAQNLLDKEIFPLTSVKNRFSLVLIDEAQDTNEIQAKVLSIIFNSDDVVIQRFGDNDQQIFDFGEKAITDPFPNLARTKNELILNETQRCSSAIITAASKLMLRDRKIDSVVEINTQLPQPHLILFDKNTVTQVIPKFIELIRNKIKLSPDAVIKVVGQIGKENPEDEKFPHTICHYEPTFIKPMNKRIGRPQNLHDLISFSRDIFAENKENFFAIHIFFSGIIRLLTSYFEISNTTAYPFRNVRDRLKGESLNSHELKGKELFEGLLDIYDLIINNDADYNQIKSKIVELVKITGFKQYTESFFDLSKTKHSKGSNQIDVDGLQIELNTIAGIKGETHTATLVLETFYRKHNIENAIQHKLGEAKPDKNTQKRIKHLYVAMTRPTSFLCLALPKFKYEELSKHPSIKQWFDSSFEVEDISNFFNNQKTAHVPQHKKSPIE